MDLVTGAITGTLTLVSGGLSIFAPTTFIGGAIVIGLVGTMLIVFAGGVMRLARGRRR